MRRVRITIGTGPPDGDRVIGHISHDEINALVWIFHDSGMSGNEDSPGSPGDLNGK